MNISLITFSRAKNYGGILQAYALFKFLENDGHGVQFIDYIPERSNIYNPKQFVKRSTSRSRLWGKNAITRFLWEKLYFDKIKKDYLKFFYFIEKECAFSTRYFSYDELVENPPISDLYLVGSDQVWNSDYTTKKQLDLPFYLTFTKAKKISYASSFGNGIIPDSHKNSVREYISEFSHVSVREESGKSILGELGIRAEVVLDPTMLFDQEFWLKKCNKPIIEGTYLLLYQVRFDKKVYETAKYFARKMGMKIVILSMNRADIIKYGSSIVMTPDVEDWLSYIKNASFVYTDSFHATVFSILFHVPFVVNSASRQKMSSRISNLLDLIELDNREMKDFDVEKGYLKFGQTIDWEKTDRLIQMERERSINWLRNALEK
ncbi:polysaccharide pyruvyl transferase family protein [[Clostridium] aminophilum]|uniref:Polysaccharide pyruvyl transferase n=1 Tax=[Clostridium] aminophilum TaxID=1526 RepID=A0A1I6JL10_9FIRM|nr:polysaccharide pyruvyl transferase family protein [[Clostridium] aminophilum]SFR79587.1 Polysaccharide pyruvyl transferase [[Clostridium] aminophilum]